MLYTEESDFNFITHKGHYNFAVGSQRENSLTNGEKTNFNHHAQIMNETNIWRFIGCIRN